MKKGVFLALIAGWVLVGALGAGSGVAHAQNRVPLPSTLPLLGLGLAALYSSRRKGN